MKQRMASDQSPRGHWVELPRPTVDGGHTLERALPVRRTAPSAGAGYALETWVAVGSVLAVAAGSYRDDPSRHALSLGRPSDRRKALAAAAFDDAAVKAANTEEPVCLMPVGPPAWFSDRDD